LPGSDTATAADVTAAVPTAEEGLPLPMSPADLRERARSGGPPKDGIPSIDDPQFVGASDADFLDPGDPVFGVVLAGLVGLNLALTFVGRQVNPQAI